MAVNKRKLLLGIFFAIAIGIPAICGIGGYVVYRNAIGSDADKLPAIRRQAQALGIPLEPAETMPNPPIPESENAAFAYKQAFQAFEGLTELKPPGYEQLIGLQSYNQAPVNVATAREALTASRPILAMLEKAASFDRCYFAQEYRLGFDVSSPELDRMRDCSHLLVAMARSQAYLGDFRGAVATLVCSARMSRHTVQAPALRGLLLGLPIARITLRVTEDLLTQRPKNEAVIAGLDRVLDALGPLPSARRASIADVPQTLVGLRSIHTWTDVVRLSGSSDSWNHSGPVDKFLISNPDFMKAVEAKYLRTMVKFVRRIPADPDDLKGFRAAGESADFDAMSDTSLTGRVALIVYPILARLPVFVASLHAHENLDAVAAKLLAIRASGRPLPDVLPDFGKISIDPMDGKKLHYQRIGQGFKLYAIGRDLVDHRGIPRPRNPVHGQEYDDVLEFK